MDEKKDQRVTIMMSESELAIIDKWAHTNKFRSRGEAMRQLLAAALAVLPHAQAVRNAFVHAAGDSEAMSSAMSNLVKSFSTTRLIPDQATSKLSQLFEDHSFEGGDSEATMDVVDYILRGKAEEPLTSREIFIVDRLAEGHDDEAIGDILGLSGRAVALYINMMQEKTRTIDRESMIDEATIAFDIRDQADLWK